MSSTLAFEFANHCAPAICGIKSSNLINCKFDLFDDLIGEIEELNKKYNPNYKFVILKKTRNNALILVYKTNVLENTIYEVNNYNYLYGIGYPLNEGIDCVIEHLKERINNFSDFPHEIGVFLGYSLDDVLAFNDKTKKCLYVGIWKVYYDVEGKLKIFEKYNRCRDVVVKLLNKGFNIEKFFN